jgi:N-acetylmuramoyl-L-alanine amidase
MSVGFQTLRRLFWLIALSITAGALSAGELTGIRLSSGPEGTRIVLDLDHAASHRLFELADPNRIVIDLPQTAASASLSLPVPKGKVRAVRTGARPGGELRVVFDLTTSTDPQSFLLPPEGSSGHRLVVDLSDAAAATATALAATPTAAPVRRLTETYTGRDLVIVVDAGHGGRDPGATGPRGVREKDVVLEIARRLAGFIDAQPGLKAVLVRDDDRFVALNDRLRIAREARADLFISIHADSLARGNAEGATVFALDTGRASSETAKRLADRENAADLLGGVSISDKDDVLARVLLDLSQNVAISKSIDAGEEVIARLSGVTTMRKMTVEQGSFLVLTSPDIPSVFVETAYISNPREESNLRDPAFQNMFAHALFAGVLDYFRTNSPPDSYLAHNPPADMRGPIRHVIARGETLSEIAERYRISLRELRRTNQINGDVIRIGQVLTIPTNG